MPAIKNRMLEIGVTGIAAERRSPEYLAKFAPKAIVDKLNEGRANDARLRRDREQSDEFAARIRSDFEKWGRVIREADIRAAE